MLYILLIIIAGYKCIIKLIFIKKKNQFFTILKINISKIHLPIVVMTIIE